MQRVNSDLSKRVSGGTIAAANTSEVAVGEHDERCKDWGSAKKRQRRSRWRSTL